jgi:hypothetical protein
VRVEAMRPIGNLQHFVFCFLCRLQRAVRELDFTAALDSLYRLIESQPVGYRVFWLGKFL